MNDRADGLLGGFVIKSPDETVPIVDGERVKPQREYHTILQDWSTSPSSEQWLCHIHTTMKWVGWGFDDEAKEKCWAPKRTYDGSNVGGSIPLSAILVGDKGWHSQEDIIRRPSRIPLTTYRIYSGDYILFRFVNGGVSQGIMVWLEDHDMYVVAGDGAEVKPVKVDAVAIFPGERYDILVKGLENPAKKYYRFIFETMEYFNWDWTIGQPQFALANLEYQNVQGEETDEVDFGHRKCTPDSKCVVLNCPFERFPDNFNFECMSAHHLENGRTVADPEILEKKQFSSGYDI
ncbi:Protein F21D5.3 a [Aphelenchoides avenae]|nr:Protein F21D5.3 a [Aphelenchus avenae]